MIDFDKVAEEFKAQAGYELPTAPDTKHVRVIGTLDNGNESVKFVSDFGFIYANNKLIISTCNDQWTAMAVFDATLKAVCGDNYESEL